MKRKDKIKLRYAQPAPQNVPSVAERLLRAKQEKEQREKLAQQFKLKAI